MRGDGSVCPVVDALAYHREHEILMLYLSAPRSATLYNKPREIHVKSRNKLWFTDLWRARGDVYARSAQTSC